MHLFSQVLDCTHLPDSFLPPLLPPQFSSSTSLSSPANDFKI